MDGKTAAAQINQERRFLNNVLQDFKPEHGGFRPTPEMMTVAQQINHIAHTIRWFQDGAFGTGFDMDFAKFGAENAKPWTLEQAMKNLDAAYDAWIKTVEGKTPEELTAPMAPNDILGPRPRFVAIHANSDHTAHHRGALAVYLRLLGVVPKMVYM